MPVQASSTFNEALDANVVVIAAPVPASTPTFQASRQYNIVLFAGDSISATVTWADASNGFAIPNDIDIALDPPSMVPVPLIIPPDQATIVAIADQRVARATCTDDVAQSHNHQLLGEPGGIESLTYTVPANGELGGYALLVRGFFLSASQPYTLSLTATSGGADVTAERLVPAAGGAPSTASTLITTNPHCQFL
jgi:hypothetical protein